METDLVGFVGFDMVEVGGSLFKRLNIFVVDLYRVITMLLKQQRMRRTMCFSLFSELPKFGQVLNTRGSQEL